MRETFHTHQQRRYLNRLQKRRAAKQIELWNALYPPGTVVNYRGKKCKTAGRAAHDQWWWATVFLHGIPEPVDLADLMVPEAKKVKTVTQPSFFEA